MVFVVTYLLRPAGSQLIHDHLLYTILRIGSFEEHWLIMVIAVPLAILSFAVGYRWATARFAEAPQPFTSAAIVGKDGALTLSYWLIAWGYVVTLATIKSTGAVQGDTAAGGGVVYEHSTAWFAQGDTYVSTGSLLYYLLTGNLGMSLVLAGPWLLARVVRGWGRINIVAYLMGLLPIYFLFSQSAKRSTSKLKVVLLMIAVLLLVVVGFPLLSLTRSMAKESGMSMNDVYHIVTNMGMSSTELLDANLGTDSSITGFEPSLYHIVVDSRPVLGTWYFYFLFIEPIPRIIWPGKGTVFDWPLWLLGIDWDPLPTMIAWHPVRSEAPSSNGAGWVFRRNSCSPDGLSAGPRRRPGAGPMPHIYSWLMWGFTPWYPSSAAIACFT